MFDCTIAFRTEDGDFGDEYKADHVEGRAALSLPYRYDVNFHTHDNLTLAQLRAATYRLSFNPKPGADGAHRAMYFYGSPQSVERRFNAAHSATGRHYEVQLVPLVANAAHNRRTRVFQQTTDVAKTRLDDVVLLLLKEWGVTPDWSPESRKLHAQRGLEFLLQYDESDLEFLSRSLATQGYFFCFHHDENAKQEKMVINHRAPDIDPLELSFIQANLGHAGISEFHVLERQHPHDVVVIAHDHMHASHMTAMSKTVTPPAASDPMFLGRQGSVCEFVSVDHANVDQTRETKAYIEARASQMAHALTAEARVYSGTCSNIMLRVGGLFKFKDPGETFKEAGVTADAVFLVTETTTKLNKKEDDGTVSFDVAFRAIRREDGSHIARRPHDKRIAGTLQAVARIESQQQTLPIDDRFRYGVQLFCDTGGCFQEHGEAANFISGRGFLPARFARPSTGKDFGLHIPLRGGTEVLVAFVNGDPQSPVLIGTLPNSETPALVTKDNHNQSVWRTPGGIRLVASDAEGVHPEKCDGGLG